jgi:arylsulfatase A-like enzyme
MGMVDGGGGNRKVHGGLWNYGIGNAVPALPPDAHTWVWDLKSAGYRTAYFGKWHVNPDYGPAHYGFDASWPGGDPQNRKAHGTEPVVLHPVEKQAVYGLIGGMDPRPLQETDTHVLARRCLEHLDELAAGSSPWHVRLDFAEPHEPCYPAEPFASMYDPASVPEWANFREGFANKPYIQQQQLYTWNVEDWTWREWSVYLAGYFGVISQYDDAVGRVVAGLEELGLLSNTMIVFTSDHGDPAGSHRIMEKVHVMYDELVRVPLVVRWDGVVDPGRRNDDFISHFLDLGPTVLEAAGLPVPDAFQGISFLDRLGGGSSSTTRDCITSSCNGQQFGLYSQRMIRDKNYKYIWNCTDIDELYDLENDPYEMRNLVGTEGSEEILAAYRRRLYEERSKLRDPLVSTLWMRNQLLNPGRKLAGRPALEEGQR